MHSKLRPGIVPLVSVLFAMTSVAACGTNSGPTPGTGSSGEPSAAGSASVSGTGVAPVQSGPPPVCTGDCYVLLEPTAVLRVRPAADAPMLTQVPDDREEPGRRRIPLHYVGEKDGWVEVETLADRGGVYHNDDRVYGGETGEPIDLGEHCYEGAVLAGRGLGVHFYVRRDELETVTTRPVRVEFPDRTAVALAPGVVVEPLPEPGVHRVRISYLTIELALPADGVGIGYVAAPLFRAESGSTYLRPADLADGVLAYQQGKLVQASAPEGGLSSLMRQYPISASKEIDSSDRPGHRLVTIEQPCIRITGIVDAKHVASHDDSALARLVGKPAVAASQDLERAVEDTGEDTARDAARNPVLRAGAPLYWKDGQIAGRTLEEIPLHLEPGATGERQCRRFERESRTRGMVGILSARSDDKPPGEPLELCFAVADISK